MIKLVETFILMMSIAPSYTYSTCGPGCVDKYPLSHCEKQRGICNNDRKQCDKTVNSLKSWVGSTWVTGVSGKNYSSTTKEESVSVISCHTGVIKIFTAIFGSENCALSISSNENNPLPSTCIDAKDLLLLRGANGSKSFEHFVSFMDFSRDPAPLVVKNLIINFGCG